MTKSRCRLLLAALLSTTVTMSAASPASASFHLLRIVEVFAGAPSAPNAQYVVLQMFSGGQTFVNGAHIVVSDSTGAIIGQATFTSNVGNGANQAKILIATPQAEAFFGISADLEMPALIPARGGRICFSSSTFGNVDCVAWGFYSGPSTGVGTPCGLIAPGRSIVRRLDTAGSPTTLDSGDDTDNSGADFRSALPAPRNNFSQSGTTPASNCGNGTLEGIEQCDDHNLVNGDGCSNSCSLETLVDVEPGAPRAFDRLEVAPNPFTDQASFSFTLALPAAADVAVYDLRGRRVKALHHAVLAAGPHRFAWDGRDDRGRIAASGFYVVRVRSAGVDLRSGVVLRR